MGIFYNYEETVAKLWESDKVSQEDKEWLDKMSTKTIFRLSEKERIYDLSMKVFNYFPTGHWDKP